MRKILAVSFAASLFTACTPNATVNKSLTPGTAKFTNYLAIGSSYTAGFADSSLYVSGQLNSLPQRLFEQFTLVGARGPFIQPLLHGEEGYPNPKKILAETYSICDHNDSSLTPIWFPSYVPDPADANKFVSGVNNNQVNNIGVPGLRVVDFPVAGYGAINVNPYANRFFYNTATTPMDELYARVNNINPTFFTLWLGIDDVLGYALAGGQGDGSGFAVPGVVNHYNIQDISPTAAFQANYDTIVNLAISTGSNGALINIPDITALPFFTAVPVNGLVLNTMDQVNALQNKYDPGHVKNFAFQLGNNFFVVRDHNGNVRQAIPTELILMSVPMDSIKCRGWGSTVPIPSQYVLTTDELQNIRSAVVRFNTYIADRAILHRLSLVDMNSYFANQLTNGITYNGIRYSTQFITGGAFSLDGIHPTERGNALLANQIITTINNFYHANIPLTNVNQYHGIDYP